MEDNVQQIEQQKTVQGTTKFGVQGLKNPTPIWATWVFRIGFILTGVITFIVAADPAISDELKIRLGVYLRAADLFIWGVTRAIGVEIDRDMNVPANK